MIAISMWSDAGKFQTFQDGLESGNRENWGGRQGSVNEEEEEDYPMEPTGQRRGEAQWKRRV